MGIVQIKLGGENIYLRRQLRLVAVVVAAAHQQHEIGEGSEEDRRTKIVAEGIDITITITITIVIGTLTAVSWL